MTDNRAESNDPAHKSEDAWAYTPEHRLALERAHEDSRAGRVRQLSENELRALVENES